MKRRNARRALRRLWTLPKALPAVLFAPLLTVAAAEVTDVPPVPITPQAPQSLDAPQAPQAPHALGTPAATRAQAPEASQAPVAPNAPLGVPDFGSPVGEPVSPLPFLLTGGDRAGNASVARVVVEVDRNGVPADGQSAVAVVVRLFDANDAPLSADVLISIEVSGGRVLLDGAATDELGPGRRDALIVPGTQLQVLGGVARFRVLAPATPQDVTLRITAGAAQAEGVIAFVPALRDWLAVGLVEGVIRLSQRDPQLIQPVRLDDGFETELRRFQRAFDNGRGDAAGRGAFYLKGRISGQALLTAAYDSEKETRARLLRDIRPESFYPVYGDSSVTSFDARSSSHLYVRVDEERSWLLWGDFSTGDGFAQQADGGKTAPVRLRSLGNYSRTLTGAKLHWEGQRGLLNVFAARDTLSQVTEELRAFGLSGPFVLRNNSALENSEKVEILVRNKDNPGEILSITPLARFDDYNFEPFSGRILLNRPLPSVNAKGDPQSLRITYEVDQGGDAFWVAGVDGQIKLADAVTLGGSAVLDDNPVAPYRLNSVNVGARLAEHTRLTVELAGSSSRLYQSAGGALRSTHPTFALGEQTQDAKGGAARIAFEHHGAWLTVDGTSVHSARGFYNPNAPLHEGRSEDRLKAAVQLTDGLRVFGEVLHSEDSRSGGQREGGALGLAIALAQRVEISVGLRSIDENAQWNGSNNLIVPNATPGSPLNPTGGFAGGIDPTVIDPVTGNASQSFAPLPSTPAGQGIAVAATTVFVGARAQVSEQVDLEGLAEQAVEGDDKFRLVAGGSYRIGERSRLTVRAESQSGLTSAYGAQRSSALSFGADTAYMPGGQLLSEYRLRDATAREAQWANGVRNTWSVSPGHTWTTSAELLHVLQGAGSRAAAIALGYDWTTSSLWKLGSRLEVRRLFDNPSSIANEQSDALLSTLRVARKLDRDWTLLFRNYLLMNRFASTPRVAAASATTAAAAAQAAAQTAAQAAGTSVAGYDAVQDRFQIGAAYRPVDSTAFDLLTKYEHLLSRNADGQVGTEARVHVGSVHAVMHPSRVWWWSGRLAVKARSDRGLSADGVSRYAAALVSGRVIFDVTENWDVGLLLSMLRGTPGDSRQSAAGMEAGYQMRANLWLSAGFNVRGFLDRDLTGSDYTNRGAFLRLRFKFDEDLFRGDHREVNRALDREDAR